MGHLIFIVLHLAALLFFWQALFATIPLHAIYAATRGKPAAYRCPDCKEGIKRDANVCMHCGCKLVPSSELPDQPLSDRLFNGPRREGVKRPA